MKTLYDLLGVRPNADSATIRAAFRKAVKACHPDANAGDRTAEQRFMEITAAHAILRDPERRANYDRALERRRQKLLREWKITLVGWGLSAVMSAGVVSAGVIVVPKWVGKSNLVGSAFATRFPTANGKSDESAAKPAVAAMATPVEAAAKPHEEVNPAPLTSGQTAEGGKDKQHDPPLVEVTASTSAGPGSEHPALAEMSAPAAAPGRPDDRPAGGEPDRSSTKGGSVATKGVDRHRETRLEAYLVGKDRLADSLLRTHIFEPEEVEQILGFAEATPDQPADECLPEKLRHSVRHHHHKERRTAFRRWRVPRG
jgi:curved DNA-binding protein CbpA